MDCSSIHRWDESEARQAGHKLLIGKRPMSRVARAREKSETQGFIKIVVDAESNRILGASILGLSGDEVVHSLLDAMYAKLPYTAGRRGVRTFCVTVRRGRSVQLGTTTLTLRVDG